MSLFKEDIPLQDTQVQCQNTSVNYCRRVFFFILFLLSLKNKVVEKTRDKCQKDQKYGIVFSDFPD